MLGGFFFNICVRMSVWTNAKVLSDEMFIAHVILRTNVAAINTMQPFGDATIVISSVVTLSGHVVREPRGKRLLTCRRSTRYREVVSSLYSLR